MPRAANPQTPKPSAQGRRVQDYKARTHGTQLSRDIAQATVCLVPKRFAFMYICRALPAFRTCQSQPFIDSFTLFASSAFTMYIPAVNIVFILILCPLSFAAPPAAPQLDSRLGHSTLISKRASPPSQGHVSLSTNSTGSPLLLPWGIRCYTPDFERTLITYDTCLPLLDKMSTEDDFRELKPYKTRNPVVFKITSTCQFTGWPGPARDDSITNQYIAAMAVWYAPLPFLLCCVTTWRGL